MKKRIFEGIFYAIIIILGGVISWYFVSDYYQLLDKKKELQNEALKLGILNDYGDIDLSSVYLEKSKLENELLEKYDTIDAAEINAFIDEVNSSNNLIEEEIVALNGEVETLNSKVEQLEKQYNVLKKRKEETQDTSSYDTYLIEDVITFNQYPNYPTGCESVALYILLRYYDVDVTVDDIISKLPKGDIPYYKDEVLYGGNPYLEFVGSPYSSDSFGVFDVPIYNVALQYKEGIVSGKGNDLDTVLGIVSQGRPVMVWTSMYLALPYVSRSWIYPETNEIINWPANEHVVVIVGFNEDYVIISDPIDGKIKYQDRNLFESRYNYYGKRNLYY